MPEVNANNTANVSGGHGVAGGYFFCAPVGTPLPTGIDAALDPAFKCMGFISEDGIVFSSESDSEELPDMNGDTMDTLSTSATETIAMTLGEVKKATQALMYGSANVTDEGGLLTVNVKGIKGEEVACVFKFLLKNDRKWVRTCEKAKVTELGDLTIASEELVGREITMSVYKGTNGNFYTDYIESTETEAA